MALDMFLKLEGIPGETKDEKHPGEIHIESFSWGMSNQVNFGSGSGGGAGKVAISEMNFTKAIDKASAKLMYNCSAGVHIPSGVVTFRKSGDKPLEYYVIKLTDVMVSSVMNSGSNGGDVLMESVSIGFAQVQVAYNLQKQDGSPEVAGAYGWNVQKNAKV